ncbi:unnamed protein product [Ectocarpus fasciculatus]
MRTLRAVASFPGDALGGLGAGTLLEEGNSRAPPGNSSQSQTLTVTTIKRGAGFSYGAPAKGVRAQLRTKLPRHSPKTTSYDGLGSKGPQRRPSEPAARLAYYSCNCCSIPSYHTTTVRFVRA